MRLISFTSDSLIVQRQTKELVPQRHLKKMRPFYAKSILFLLFYVSGCRESCARRVKNPSFSWPQLRRTTRPIRCGQRVGTYLKPPPPVYLPQVDSKPPPPVDLPQVDSKPPLPVDTEPPRALPVESPHIGTPKPPPINNEPPYNCLSPSGSDCKWYKLCLEKQYQFCQNHQYEYAITHGLHSCNVFLESLSEFSADTKAWMNATRKCLQVNLVQYLYDETKLDCKTLYLRAFETHSDCYLNPGNDRSVSICELSCPDVLIILLKVIGNKRIWSLKALPPTIKEMVQVLFGCESGCIAMIRFILIAPSRLNPAVLVGRAVLLVRDKASTIIAFFVKTGKFVLDQIAKLLNNGSTVEDITKMTAYECKSWECKIKSP